MPLCQYFAYIEVRESNEDPVLSAGDGATGLWRGYETLAAVFPNFAMKKVGDKGEIFPVFHELFTRKYASPVYRRAGQ